MKKSKESLKNLWHTINESNIYILVSQKKVRERGGKVIERDFPNVMKYINLQIQETYEF